MVLGFAESVVFTLRARDADANDTEHSLVFSIAPALAGTAEFNVSSNGYLYPTVELDFETTTSYGPYNFQSVCGFTK